MLRENFCDRYELDSYGTDYGQFLEGLDIIYIRSGLKTGQIISERHWNVINM